MPRDRSRSSYRNSLKSKMTRMTGKFISIRMTTEINLYLKIMKIHILSLLMNGQFRIKQ